MSVIITYPKLKLAAQLREAGGLAVADAIAAADANLESVRPQCVVALQQAVADAAAAFQAFPAGFSTEALQGLYAIAARAVGVGAAAGAPGADAALVSLCDLLDRLATRGRWDREAIAVHVQTLQLLSANLGTPMDAATVDQVLGGLRKVSARYAEPPAAASGG